MLCFGFFKKRTGYADITSATYPSQIEINKPFTISYVVKNTGNTDVLYGYLTVDGITLLGSSWKQTVNKGAIVTKVFNHFGIDSSKNIIIEVGYE